MIFETISVPIRVLMKGNKKAQPLLISDDLETTFVPIRVLKNFQILMNSLFDCFCKVNHHHAVSGISGPSGQCFGDAMSKDSNGTKKQAKGN